MSRKLKKHSFYTTAEIAEILKIHQVTVQNMIKDGRLKAIKIRNKYRINKDDFDAFLKESKVNDS